MHQVSSNTTEAGSDPGDSAPYSTGTGLLLACLASVYVWFRSKERPWNGIFGFGRARNETRALLLAPIFSRSLTLVPRSLLLNRTETLATQAMLLWAFYSYSSPINARHQASNSFHGRLSVIKMKG